MSTIVAAGARRLKFSIAGAITLITGRRQTKRPCPYPEQFGPRRVVPDRQFDSHSESPVRIEEAGGQKGSMGLPAENEGQDPEDRQAIWSSPIESVRRPGRSGRTAIARRDPLL